MGQPLETIADQYLYALNQNNPSLLNWAPGVRYSENAHDVAIGEGMWKTTGRTSFRRYAVDEETGEVCVMAVVADDGRPANLFVRLRIAGHAIAEVEAVLAKEGGFIVNPTGIPARQEDWDRAIPSDERLTRTKLVDVARGYFVGFDTQGTSKYQRPPLASECDRWENGTLTTNVAIAGLKPMTALEQFDAGMWPGFFVGEQRYPVADTARGVCIGIVVLNTPAAGFRVGDVDSTESWGLLVAEWFKIERGLITLIQTVACHTPWKSTSGWQ